MILKEFLSQQCESHFIVKLKDNLYKIKDSQFIETQTQVADSFSFKWGELREDSDDLIKASLFSQRWFLSLYGFKDELDLANHLKNKKLVLDAGCGKGYKAAWIAKMSPSTTVLAIDISDSVVSAAQKYQEIPNLIFLQGDIGSLPYLKDNSFDFVYCDQVIMHTTNPEDTFKELTRITSKGGEFLTYVYRKKAVPRELLDTYFRHRTLEVSNDAVMEMSRQLTDLGKMLEVEFGGKQIHFPAIPLLGIQAGEMSIQRFIYWNFLKCFWNEELGYDVSVLTNFDWYSPSQASRYSKEEFHKWISDNKLEILTFHEEEACYSGRFLK